MAFQEFFDIRFVFFLEHHVGACGDARTRMVDALAVEYHAADGEPQRLTVPCHDVVCAGVAAELVDGRVLLGAGLYGDSCAVVVELVVDALHKRPGAQKGPSLGFPGLLPLVGAAFFAEVLADALDYQVAYDGHHGFQVLRALFKGPYKGIEAVYPYFCVDKI